MNKNMTPKERPILFSAPMVRAILDGSKSQTRRVIDPQSNNDRCKYEYIRGNYTEWILIRSGNLGIINTERIKCPYGYPGDKLWVRETFRLFDSSDECGCSEHPCNCPPNNWPLYRADGDNSDCKWKPSIHMPRWASRINLEITNIRVERLNDISEDDAKTEGAHPINFGYGDCYKLGFKQIWESINGHGSWDKNPWVWVVKFRRISR